MNILLKNNGTIPTKIEVITLLPALPQSLCDINLPEGP